MPRCWLRSPLFTTGRVFLSLVAAAPLSIRPAEQLVVAEALLASWRQTPTKSQIVAFVSDVTAEDGDTIRLPAERVAVFDNDGTLWSEKPIPIQLDFTLYRFAELAKADSSSRGSAALPGRGRA